jgi:hypothetical protein
VSDVILVDPQDEEGEALSSSLTRQILVPDAGLGGEVVRSRA